MSKKNALLIQSLLVAILFAVGYYFYSNAVQHLTENNIASGFGFLNQPAGFDVIMNLIDYSPNSTYLRAFYVGILNTLLITVLSIVLATIIGILFAAGSLASNWLLAKLSTIFVDTFRNVPLLLQIFLWYYLQLHYLPQASASWDWFGIFNVSVRGVFYGNYVMIPEMTAMLLGLSLYYSAFIADVTRNGIKSIDKGQLEAAAVFGFSPYLTLKLIILPQVTRLIVPHVVNHYLNILKNSSLGCAIGYPDLVAVFAGTVLNQTGQAIETIFMTMSFFLIINIVVSYGVNWYSIKAAQVYK